MIVVDERITIPDTELTVSWARSGGAGGQHVNKTSTKAVLRWSFGSSTSLSLEVKERFRNKFGTRLSADDELILNCDGSRSASTNLNDCEERLAEMVRSVLTAPRKRKKTKPTKSALERRKQEKKMTKNLTLFLLEIIPKQKLRIKGV